MLCSTVKAGTESLTCNKNSFNSSISAGPEDLLLLPDLPALPRLDARPAPVPAGVGTPSSPCPAAVQHHPEPKIRDGIENWETASPLRKQRLCPAHCPVPSLLRTPPLRTLLRAAATSAAARESVPVPACQNLQQPFWVWDKAEIHETI